ncbi:MAG: class I SAM-dependent methyltransferase [Ferruginibacter sp.]|nr:class I SAM-dependent methyltransferase [Ferruginibacter sp.]
MRCFSYIKYFYFLFTNWNIRIAWVMIRQEIKGEKKYAIHTTGADELFKLEDQGIDISHATIYMPVSYALLEEVFERLNYQKQQTTNSKPFNHFLDIGCGKGRALCVAAHHGFKKVTGLDFARGLCETAKENLAVTKQKIPELEYKVINNDAFYFEVPDDVDCIFLFNPFDEIIMSAVVNNIFSSLQNNPRKITIIYVNPLHKDLFLKAGYKETWYSKKMKYLEASILESR